MTELTPPEKQDIPPLVVIPIPEHVSSSPWQSSYHDCTSQAPLGDFVKIDQGTDFPDSGAWKQV